MNKLNELLVDHQILMYRHDAYLRSLVNKRLSEAQKTLLAEVLAYGTDINSKEFKTLLKEIKIEINSVYSGLSTEIQQRLDDLYPIQVLGIAKVYNKALGYDVFPHLPKYKLDSIKHTHIVADMPISDWWGKQADNLKFKFEQTIRRGMMLNESNYDLAKKIKNDMQVANRTAQTLVRTATAQVSNDANMKLAELFPNVVEGYQFQSTLDSRTSEICRGWSGLRWDKDEKPIGHNIPFENPPLHPNCRSYMALLVDNKARGTQSSEGGYVDGNWTYDDWVKIKSHEQQNEILGKGKAQLFRDGKITLRDTLDQTGRPLTLEKLKNKYGLD